MLRSCNLAELLALPPPAEPPPLAEQPAASLRRYVVDEASGLLFCWMPKVACTSFKAWLRRLAGVADVVHTTDLR